MSANRQTATVESTEKPVQSVAELEREIRLLLPELTSALEELISVYGLKTSAMREASVIEIHQLAEREASLAQRIERCLRKRQRLLKDAVKFGLARRTMRELITALPNLPREELLKQLDEIQRHSLELRLTGWSHWIVAHRVRTYYSEMIDLIAQGGQRSPTYNQFQQREGNGGILLDTSI